RHRAHYAAAAAEFENERPWRLAACCGRSYNPSWRSAMRRSRSVHAAIVFFGLTVGYDWAGAQPSKSDEAAVRGVVKSYLDAREHRDGAAVGALFTEDADQLVSSGEWRRGRDAIVRGTLASSASNSGARTITIQTVRFPAKDVALADGP